MAEIRVPQEVVQFAYQEPGTIRVMQLVVQFAYETPEMILWPDTLPMDLLIIDFKENPPDNVYRFPPDIGPPKKRRRFTAGITEIPFVLELTSTQWDALLEFYYDDLAEVSSFIWLHPRTGATTTFEFKSPPKMSQKGVDNYRVEFTLQIRPI